MNEARDLVMSVLGGMSKGERNQVKIRTPNDPARDSHRDGVAWAKGAVRAILTNPRYTGYQVWKPPARRRSPPRRRESASHH